MLSSIGRASIRRVVAGRQSTNGAVLSIFGRVEEFQSKRTSSIRSQSQLPTYRTYATTTATKTAPKKTTTTKTPAKTKPKAKKSETSKTAKKPTKKPAKKVVAKAKTKPRGLTELQKEKLAVKLAKQKERTALQKTKEKVKAASEKSKLALAELKAKALENPKLKARIGFAVWMAETKAATATGLGRGEAFKAAAEKYAQLSPDQKEHYVNIAAQNAAANKVIYKQWVESHTPEVIREANLARTQLRKKSLKGYSKIQDERAPLRPVPPAFQFIHESRSSGEVVGAITKEKVAPVIARWNSMSAAERQPYVDRYNENLLRYQQEYKTVFHRDAPKMEPKEA